MDVSFELPLFLLPNPGIANLVLNKKKPFDIALDRKALSDTTKSS